MRRFAFAAALASLVWSGGAAAAQDKAAPSDTGLWIADLPLCADTVADMAEGVEETDGALLLNIELTDEAGQRLAALTEKAVGKTVTVWLDGKVLMEPVVQEKIVSGRLTIAGIESDQLERAEAAAAGQCPAAGDDDDTTLV